MGTYPAGILCNSYSGSGIPPNAVVPPPIYPPQPTPVYPPPKVKSLITACSDCITPTSDDPSTVEYYGYSSSPTWCLCVGPGAICNSTLVATTAGNKLGYYCIIDNTPPAEVQYLIQNNGCIYPYNGCQLPYNFIASKVFINPFNRPATVTIVGSADDDAFLEYSGGSFWLRNPGSPSPTCSAGGISYSITVGSKENFRITGYDIYGLCGNVSLTVTFT